MILHSIRIPQGERFCASPRALKRTFYEMEDLNIYLGVLSKSFSFDSRCSNRPSLLGPVVASLSVSRERMAIMQLYVLPRHVYPNQASAEFEISMLPRMRDWLQVQFRKPETAVLGCESLIIEWVEGAHLEHSLRFL